MQTLKTPIVPATVHNLFDTEFLKKLAYLKFVVKKILLSGGVGEKTSRQRGGRLEFSDYRKYAPGDEANYIDWNVFARTGKLFVKEFAKEEEYLVYLVLDLTASMGPTKQVNKLNYAKQLTCALGYVALVAGNRLKISGFSNNSLSLSKEFYNEGQIYQVMEHLSPRLAQGKTNISYTLGELDKRLTEKGVLIIISDFFDPIDPRKELIRFTNRGFEVSIIHLISPAEENPDLAGPLKLKDVETSQTRSVFISDSERLTYRKELNNWIDAWKNFCHKHAIRYFHINTALPLEALVLNFLKRGGLLK